MYTVKRNENNQVAKAEYDPELNLIKMFNNHGFLKKFLGVYCSFVSYIPLVQFNVIEPSTIPPPFEFAFVTNPRV